MVANGRVREPHPYLLIWLGCRRHSSEYHKVLPDSGGWLDQDAELLLAFEIVDDLYAEEMRAAEIRQKQMAELAKRREVLLAR